MGSMPVGGICLGKSLFQLSNSTSELKIVCSADEHVHVIGHDHISTNGNAMI